MTTAPSPSQPTATAEESFVRPEYRSWRGEDHFGVEVFLPGVPRDALDVKVEEGVLTVTGRRVDDVPPTWRSIHEELPKPNYRLRLRVHEDVDTEAVSAKVDAGVLRLTLPVKAAAKPRLIPVE